MVLFEKLKYEQQLENLKNGNWKKKLVLFIVAALVENLHRVSDIWSTVLS